MLADDTNVITATDRALLHRVVGSRTEWEARAVDAHHLGAAQGETIVRMCSSKKSWFRTQPEADKAAHDCTLRHGEPFFAYLCRACARYHLTTRRPA